MIRILTINNKYNSLINELKNRISYLKTLKQNWDFHGGEIISLEILEFCEDLAKNILKINSNLSIELMPLSNGGIVFTSYYKDDFLDLEINPDYTFNFSHERGIGQDYQNVEEKYNCNKEFYYLKVSNLCESLGLSHRRNLVLAKIGSVNMMPSTHTKIAYPLSNLCVFKTRAFKQDQCQTIVYASQNVNTSNSFISAYIN